MELLSFGAIEMALLASSRSGDPPALMTLSRHYCERSIISNAHLVIASYLSPCRGSLTRGVAGRRGSKAGVIAGTFPFFVAGKGVFRSLDVTWASAGRVERFTVVGVSATSEVD